ncbi:hypothetical protein E3P99_02164 [Wallemia hederae]|uniref:Sister chromatid cohesion protein n=1 Tax=Wallemia hederae TaxID=1540922 RepID=A0A4T0FLW0_9BASI|nr:hypothetical protein E3P99_02164 [Wallemia hederae]
MTSKFTVKSFYGGGANDRAGDSKRPIKNINDVISISPFPTTLPSSQFSRFLPEAHSYISSPASTSIKPSDDDIDAIWNADASDNEDIIDLIQKQHQLNIQDESLPNIKLASDIPIPNNPAEFDIGMPKSTANKAQKSVPPLPKSSKPKAKNTNNAEISLSMQGDDNYLYSLRNRIIADSQEASPSKVKKEPARNSRPTSPIKAKGTKKRNDPFEAEASTSKRVKQESPRTPGRPRKSPDSKAPRAVRVRFDDEYPSPLRSEKKERPAETAPPTVGNDDKFMGKILANNSLLKNMPKSTSSHRTVVTAEQSNTSIDEQSLIDLKQMINLIFDTQDTQILNPDDITKDYLEYFTDDGYVHAKVVKKMSKYLDQLYSSKPNSILELANNDYVGTQQSDLVKTLARLIKLLNSNVELGDNLSVWAAENDEFDECKNRLLTATDSILAVQCIFMIMKFDQLPKQLYFEDVLSKCLSVLKHHLSKTVYAYIEAIEEGYGTPTDALIHFARERPQAIKKPLKDLYDAINSALSSLNALMNLTHVSLGETVLYTATYISIGPFFVAEPLTKNAATKSAMSPVGGDTCLLQLRSDALTLIQNIFANYDSQRYWIIDEILSATIKLPELKKQSRQLKLDNGKSIFTLSALLFRLVQACSHSVYDQISSLRAKFHLHVLQDEESDEKNKERYMEFLMAEAAIWRRAYDPVISISQTIVSQIFNNVLQSKSQKNSHEADYKVMLENLVNDAITVLHLPEWPGASWLLVVFVKLVDREVEDQNRSATQHNNMRALTLEHFGNLYARVRSVDLQRLHDEDKNDLEPLAEIERAVANGKLAALNRLHTTYQQLLITLYMHASKDELCRSAYEMFGAQWGFAIVKGLQVSQEVLEGANGDESICRQQTGIQEKLFAYLQDIWSEDDRLEHDDYQPLSKKQLPSITLQLSSTSIIQRLQEKILAVILHAFNSNTASIRAKAVKALGTAVMSDDSLLNNDIIKRYINSRVSDVASSVRDAALDVLSRHLARNSSVADTYFEMVSKIIHDPSPAVRKRVAKLLRDIYESTTSTNRKAQIAKLFCLQIADEDDSLKDAALDALDKLWLHLPITKTSTKEKTKAKVKDEELNDDDDSSQSVGDIVDVIVSVARLFGDHCQGFEDAMQKLVKRHPSTHQSVLSTRLKAIATSLVERLDSSDEEDDPLACVRALLVVANTGKGTIGVSGAEQLLPLLTNGRDSGERSICETTLKIYNKIIPRLPAATAMRLAESLQAKLLPLVTDPQGNISQLSEAVACLCQVVTRHTNSYVVLTRILLKAATETLALLDKNKQTESTIKKCRVLIIMMSLLVQHCDFDAVREYDDMNVRERSRQQYFNAANDLDELNNMLTLEQESGLDDETEFTIPVRIWNLLMTVRNQVNNPDIRSLSLRGLGCLFVGYPFLMNDTSSIEMMDEVFRGSESDHLQLLLVFQEYLKADEHKRTKKPDETTVQSSELTVDNLIGDTDVLNDSNVGASVLTRYLPHVLDAALSTSNKMSYAAVDILGFIVKQGLTHPLGVLPTLVALETSPSGALVAKARDLHGFLHTKHASNLNTHYAATVEKAHSFRRMITGSDSGMRNDVALLEIWYGYAKEKRPTKLEFLGGVVKLFDINPMRKNVTENSISLSRFLADNLLSLGYQNNEEVLFIGKMLSTYLATHGEALRDELSYEDIDDGMKSKIRSSVIFSIAAHLKNNLKDMYGFTDKQLIDYNPKKKTPYGDKVLSGRGEMRPINYKEIPGAAKEMKERDDYTEQIDAYFDLINDTALTASDDDMLVDELSE